ncbi:hypothetical protein T440DRAFT_483058 [Plenodomus tracheiphilus IPT5]|uniref:Uncharacterized protein n=1 Tax=Plenodomus tracheiphilus IPT5 TaxID=1408161 RepID=A0A6A7ARE3_9PLEO|nr:hypothetical protein T440DRAFT_483058 [Plenodomus tracheiphilus IPT5]
MSMSMCSTRYGVLRVGVGVAVAVGVHPMSPAPEHAMPTRPVQAAAGPRGTSAICVTASRLSRLPRPSTDARGGPVSKMTLPGALRKCHANERVPPERATGTARRHCSVHCSVHWPK